MPAKQIYLAGYSRQELETLEAAVNGLGVTLVSALAGPTLAAPGVYIPDG